MNIQDELTKLQHVNALKNKLLESKDEQISLLKRIMAVEEDRSELLIKQNIELTNEIAYLKKAGN